MARLPLANTLIERRRPGRAGFGTWALPLTLVSAAAWALAFPSFIDAAGLPVLGFVCLVPVLLSLRIPRLRMGHLLRDAAGVLQTMISNYWLGTFDLLSLQFVSSVTAVQYIPFMAVALFVLHRSRPPGVPRDPGGMDAFRLASVPWIPRLPVGHAGGVPVRGDPADTDRVPHRGVGCHVPGHPVQCRGRLVPRELAGPAAAPASRDRMRRGARVHTGMGRRPRPRRRVREPLSRPCGWLSSSRTRTRARTTTAMALRP